MVTSRDEGVKAFEEFNDEEDLRESKGREELSKNNFLNSESPSYPNDDPVSENEYEAVLKRSGKAPAFNYGSKIYVDIDKLCVEIFNELAIIDNKFGFISEFFRHQAELIGQGREPEYLSEDEAKTKELYEMLTVASSGLTNIMKAADMEFKLRTEVYPRLRKIAKQKLRLVESTLPDLERLMQDDWNDFSRDAEQTHQLITYKYEEEFHDNKWRIYLKNLRNSWFHVLYLRYFHALLNDWGNDIFTASYQIPDMEDVNTQILFNLYGGNRNHTETFTDKMKERIVEVLNRKWDFVKIKDMIIIKDKELLASLQTHCPFPFALSAMGELAQQSPDKKLLQQYYENEAFIENNKLRIEAEKNIDEAKSRGNRVLINGILLTACCSLAVFSYFSTGWAIFWTAFFFIILLWRCFVIKNGIVERYGTKVEKLKVYAETVAHWQAGEGPRYKTINEVVEKKNKIWIGVILGFVIGLFIGGVGCVFGALIGAAIAGSFSREEVETNGSDWNEVKTGKGLLSKIFMWLLLAVLAWEIVFFGIGRKKDIAAEPVDVIAVQTPTGMKMEDVHEIVEETKENQMLNEKEVFKLVENLWSGLPDHGLNTLTKKILTPGFYKIVEMGFAVPNDNPGGIGSGDDLYYWYSGNGELGEGAGLRAVTIRNQDVDKIDLIAEFYEGEGYDRSRYFNIILAKSPNGKDWQIDDFDGKRKEFYKYVSTIGKEFTEGLGERILEYPGISEYMGEEEKENYRREIEEFVIKFNKTYPDGKVSL